MLAERQALHTPREAFAAEQLPWPPIPRALEQRLSERAPWVFSTRDLPRSPYELSFYLEEALCSTRLEEYAITGFAGHGINSWAAHFFLVQGALNLFVQIPWGGTYTDAQASRAELERVFAWARRLPAQLARCAEGGRIAPGEKLVVVASRFSSPGWAWVKAPLRDLESVRWNPAQGMLAAIEESVDARLASAGE